MREELMKYEVALYMANLRRCLVIKAGGDCDECEMRPSSTCTAPANILCAEMNGCWVYPKGTRIVREW